MTDDSGKAELAAHWWSSESIDKQMQQAVRQTLNQQTELYNQFVFATARGADTSLRLCASSKDMATFKSRVQKDGRISIPDTGREHLVINERDLLHAVIRPINHNK